LYTLSLHDALPILDSSLFLYRVSCSGFPRAGSSALGMIVSVPSSLKGVVSGFARNTFHMSGDTPLLSVYVNCVRVPMVSQSVTLELGLNLPVPLKELSLWL